MQSFRSVHSQGPENEREQGPVHECQLVVGGGGGGGCGSGWSGVVGVDQNPWEINRNQLYSILKNVFSTILESMISAGKHRFSSLFD